MHCYKEVSLYYVIHRHSAGYKYKQVFKIPLALSVFEYVSHIII